MANDSKSRFRQVCLAVIALVTTTGMAAAWDEEQCGRRPPMRYMHEPAQPYTVHVLPWDELQHKCTGGGAFATRSVWACAQRERSEIYILDEIPSRMRECTIIHEKAHLNGWSYFHPIR